ncbi:hypothetical protein CS022_03630 [Veronia nyctiphanis]|uniref:Acyltransferase 3 domain-containing protein n=1 Tax=Veronia nyctiphanis TaxID=1278244 RepID=A0A4Q0YWL0_9GAMM|nr:hypothetical protein [Veronia nyctiphanis]RXJ74654.1 hypothetical protein CS022_03630 [Veronia nyctiphanis]
MAKSTYQSWYSLSLLFPLFMVTAAGLYIARVKGFTIATAPILTAVEASLWILSALGTGHRYLNKPNRWLPMLSQSVYPVYLVHMLILFLLSTLLLPLSVEAGVKFVLLTTMTFLLSFSAYLVLKRLPVVLLFFGVKY